MRFYHACTDCGCPGVERGFNRCARARARLCPAQTPAQPTEAPPESVQAAPAGRDGPGRLPHSTGLGRLRGMVRQGGLRNRDEVDAHRELEYLDMMDAGL